MKRVHSTFTFACAAFVLTGIAGCGGNSLGDIFQPSPEVNSISPTSGHVGDTVTINGAFLTENGNPQPVTFNGVSATTETAVSKTVIKVVVPTGATTGPLLVLNPGTFVNGQPSESTPITFTVD